MASAQIAVRLPEHTLADLDRLVDEGLHENRAAAVRAAIDGLIDSARDRRVDRAIVDGYAATPPSGADDDAARASITDAIADEPW